MEYVLSFFGVSGASGQGYLTWPKRLALHVHDHFVPHARNNYHPHIFSRRATALLSALLVALKIFTLASLALGPVAPAFSSAITPANIISLTNASRQSFNLPALTENSMLDQAAQAKADDMLAKGYFAHITPDGKTPWDFITAAGYNYITAGENLAVNFSQAEDVETAWMNSPDHRANLLNANYKEIGIGVSQGQYQGHEAIFVVQMFGTQANEKINLTSAATPVQTQAVPPPAAAAPKTTVPQTAVKAAQTTNAPAPAPTPVIPQPINLANAAVQYQGNQLVVRVVPSPNVVKVLALAGDQGVLLQPQADGSWQANADLSDLANNNATLKLFAYDIFGNSANIQVADFAASTPANYNLVPQAAGAQVSLFGLRFDPNALEQRFYLIFIAAMVASLLIAVAVRRKVQHISLIANGAFVVMLACMLWIGT